MKATINIPESLREVTLGQYQQFLKIPDNDPFKREKLVAIFLNLDFKWVRAIKVKQLKEIVNHLEGLLNQEQELVQTFKVEDMQFGFIPKLDDMTFGEYVDVDKYMSEWETMHKAMSVLYRPIQTKLKDKYIITPYEGSNDTMQYMPLDVALSALVFFYRLKNDLLEHTPNSLLEKAKEIFQLNHNSQKNGDGTKASLLSQKGMLPSTIRLLKQTSISA